MSKANKGKFWDACISNRPLLPVVKGADLYVGYDNAYTSEELQAALDDGKTIKVYSGPAQRGFTLDISLRRLDLTPEQAKAMRTAKADHDFKAALDELAVVFANYEKSQKQRKRSKARTTADLSA